MRVLHITPGFFPATYWGGPIYSVYGLCNALAQRSDIQLQVSTTDSAGPTTAQKLEVKYFPTYMEGGYPVYYFRRLWGASFSPNMLLQLRQLINWADVVHLTAVYSPPTIPTLLLCRLMNKPIVWSPRGALQRWEGSTRKWAKRLWERLCNYLCKRERVVLHFTSDKERVESAGRISRARVVVIPNGTTLVSDPCPREWRPDSNLRLLYLGRLHPIKGIENLLHALSNIKQDITLKVCGDGDPTYRNSLTVMVKELDLQNHVQFYGHVIEEAKSACFREADVCVVPSFTENFGMVIAESLVHGVPVIASRGTPWQKVEEFGCGLWRDNSPASLAEAINQIKGMPLSEMGMKGRVWMEREFSWLRVAEEMANLYQQLIERT